MDKMLKTETFGYYRHKILYMQYLSTGCKKVFFKTFFNYIFYVKLLLFFLTLLLFSLLFVPDLQKAKFKLITLREIFA
jgi:hypothetical protein